MLKLLLVLLITVANGHVNVSINIKTLYYTRLFIKLYDKKNKILWFGIHFIDQYILPEHQYTDSNEIQIYEFHP